MKELRTDPISNDKVIFAEDRLKRPIDKCINKKSNDKKIGYKETCPFCMGNESECGRETFRIEHNNEWLVRSIYNKYPIIDNVSTKVYGTHEVMIDTNRHDGTFYNMSDKEFENLFIMYRNRFCELNNNQNAEYVSIFKNYLREAGASLDHPHSQIITLPFVPPEVQNEISVSKDYFIKNNRCLYEGIIEEERKINKRVVYDGKSFIVIIPYATKYTGEIRVLFKEKIGFNELSDTSINELAKLFKKLFVKINEVEGIIPFNIYIHTYPKNLNCRSYFNTHIHIIPRKYNFGGFELGTGVYVSSRKPEDIADKLRL